MHGRRNERLEIRVSKDTKNLWHDVLYMAKKESNMTADELLYRALDLCLRFECYKRTGTVF